MPRLTLRKVNAFTTGGVAATGNPAAVCLLDAALLGSMPDSLRQSIAADIGLSETAYVEPLDPSSSPGPDVFKQLDTFRLRWFTPAAEVPLCGHATLASAATLFTECGNPAPTLHFHTLSGILSVTRKQHSQQQLLQMSLPLSAAAEPLPPQLQPPPSCSPAAAAAAAGKADPADPSGGNAAAFSQLFAESPRLTELLYSALSSVPSTAAAAAVPVAPGAVAAAADKAAWLSHVVQHVGYVAPLKYMLVALQPALQLGRQGLEGLALDAAALEAAGSVDYLGGLIVSTLPSPGEEGGYDFHSRFFGPWLGVPEDPVTGSAHAVLAPYYAAVLRKQQLFARQCSARGGDVWMDAGAQPGRVLVSGEAVMEETWEAEY